SEPYQRHLSRRRDLGTKHGKRASLMPFERHALTRIRRSLEQTAGHTPSRALARAHDHAGEDDARYADGDGLEDPPQERAGSRMVQAACGMHSLRQIELAVDPS